MYNGHTCTALRSNGLDLAVCGGLALGEIFFYFLFRIFLRPKTATENDACRCNTSTEE